MPLSCLAVNQHSAFGTNYGLWTNRRQGGGSSGGKVNGGMTGEKNGKRQETGQGVGEDAEEPMQSLLGGGWREKK